MLAITNFFPESALECKPDEFCNFFEKPTLICLEGKKREPLFVSVLLHGNETTGAGALIELMKKYQGKNLPRTMLIFVGNVYAAKEGKRMLNNQPDYNRIFSGQRSDEEKMAQRLIEIVTKAKPFAAIDVHNNTGINPYYSCIASLDLATRRIASMFGKRALYLTRPNTTLINAFSKFCPAVTIEVGKAGAANGITHTTNYLDALLHIDHLPETELSQNDLFLYRSVGIVHPSDGIGFAIGSENGTPLQLRKNLEHYNFRNLGKGTVFAHIYSSEISPFYVEDENGDDVAGQFFEVVGKEVRLKKEIMPAMLTSDITMIKLDCLCYLMERV